MKKNILYITLIFALCFGIKAQAQNIIAYQTKVNSLSASEANKLEQLANEAPTSMFVTFEDEAKIYQGSSDVVLDMSITKATDVTKLATTFEGDLSGIVIVNMEWDGQEEIVLPLDLLNKMSNLRYIYIRSYQALDQSVIQSKFQNLMNALREKGNVEVLYTTMKQPS